MLWHLFSGGDNIYYLVLTLKIFTPTYFQYVLLDVLLLRQCGLRSADPAQDTQLETQLQVLSLVSISTL